MYEMWQLIAAYFVGTTAGVILFKTYVKEQIIVATLDNLVDQGFVKSFKDQEGLIQFMRVEDIEAEARVKQLIREATELQERMWEDNNDSA